MHVALGAGSNVQATSNEYESTDDSASNRAESPASIEALFDEIEFQ